MQFCRPKTPFRAGSPFSKITRYAWPVPKAPSTRVCFCLRTVIFFLQFCLPSKRNFSKTLSRSDIFVNAGFSLTYGRMKREVFEYDDAIHHILLKGRMLRKGCCRISIFFGFSSGRAKSIRLRYVKKISVLKNIRILVDGA